MNSNLRLLAAATLTLSLVGCSGGGGGDPPLTQPPPGGGNQNPTVNLNIDKTHLAYNETAQLSLTASDPDGDQVTFTWSGVKGTVTTSGPTATTATFKAGTTWGQGSATAAASDGSGGNAQATAQTYVRNPNPPQFTLFPVGSSTCGYDTVNPDGFLLRITPGEAVLLTSVSIRPRDCTSGQCARSLSYTTPLSLSAGQEYVWTEGGCRTSVCCASLDCGECTRWTVEISGRRPEPDGGSFTYRCYSWSSRDPLSGCN